MCVVISIHASAPNKCSLLGCQYSSWEMMTIQSANILLLFDLKVHNVGTSLIVCHIHCSYFINIIFLSTDLYLSWTDEEKSWKVK